MKEMLLIALLTAGTLAARSNRPQHETHDHAAAVDASGDLAMGFDHTRTTHNFIVTKNGGIIRVTANDAADLNSIGKIRSHLKEIAESFRAGDFTKPTFIDAQSPPGADVLKQLGPKVVYRFQEIPKGGEISITTKLAAGIKAVKDFFAMQIADHRTGDPM